MKTIYFIRHAKSSWDNMMLDDHDRTLNARGLRDAPDMAGRLAELGVVPDGILTSSAQRAQETAAFFADTLNVDEENTIVEEKLYHGWPDGIEKEVRRLPAHWNTVLLFGHNPGYTDLANRLQNDEYIANVPTCGISVAKTDITDWSEFTIRQARRVNFLFPKQES